MELKLLNDNILVKIKKRDNYLTTKSGLIVAAAEQDSEIAEVVAIPEQDFYYKHEKQPDGSEKIIKCMISGLKPGDRVFMMKEFHHDYDWHYRHKIDHTVIVSEMRDENYDYFITRYEDILAHVDETFIDGAVYTELFTTLDPKPVTRASGY